MSPPNLHNAHVLEGGSQIVALILDSEMVIFIRESLLSPKYLVTSHGTMESWGTNLWSQ